MLNVRTTHVSLSYFSKIRFRRVMKEKDKKLGNKKTLRDHLRGINEPTAID